MRQFLIAAALCGLLAWGVLREQPASDQAEQLEFFALGTLIQISSLQPLPSPLVAKLQSKLTQFENDWSVLGDGLLVQLNQRLLDEPSAPLPEALRGGVVKAREACMKSSGLFDPGMGALVQAWGFDDESEFRSAPPEPAALAATPMLSLCQAELDENIRFQTAGARLNFGASAKGLAVDQLATLLLQHGIENFIVNAGGDLKVQGRKPDRPWRIGVRHPRPTQASQLLAQLDLQAGEAVFSSGDYERFFEFEGQRYHHILDPRTRAPAGHSQSATVVHPDAQWADAASTALFVAGPGLAEQVMQNMGIQLWLLVDHQGQIQASPALRSRLQNLAQP